MLKPWQKLLTQRRFFQLRRLSFLHGINKEKKSVLNKDMAYKIIYMNKADLE